MCLCAYMWSPPQVLFLRSYLGTQFLTELELVHCKMAANKHPPTPTINLFLPPQNCILTFNMWLWGWNSGLQACKVKPYRISDFSANPPPTLFWNYIRGQKHQTALGWTGGFKWVTWVLRTTLGSSAGVVSALLSFLRVSMINTEPNFENRFFSYPANKYLNPV